MLLTLLIILHLGCCIYALVNPLKVTRRQRVVWVLFALCLNLMGYWLVLNCLNDQANKKRRSKHDKKQRHHDLSEKKLQL